MRLVEAKTEDKEIYNRFVMENETGSFLQSWEWGEWQKNLGREAYRFFVKDNERVVASLQLIKMPLPMGKYYLYCPYGPVTDLRLKIEDLRFLIQELKQRFFDAIFIRVEPKSNQIIQSFNHSIIKSSNVHPAKTLIINLSKTEEELLAEMHSKTRYNIRLAQKHGVRVEKDLAVTPRHGLYFKEAIEQIVETQKRQGYKGHAGGYYKNMIDFFGLKKESGVKINIYKALFKNQLLSSAVFFDFGQTRTYLFGGSSQENKQIMAPYLMHLQAILDAKAAGLLQYDFWGIETASGKAPGFARFKLGFGGAVLEYPGAFDYPARKLQYGIYRIFRKIKKII